MSETYIPNPTPVVVPAKEEQIFDKQYCTKIEIDAHPARPWTAKFMGLPYDGVEVLDYPYFQMDLQDLKELALLDAELAQAMGGVLAVIGKYLVKGKVNGISSVNADNIAEVLA